MNGKRFVFGIMGIVVTLLLVLEALIWIWPLKKYMIEEYVWWQQQKEYTLANHGKQEIILLGDSRMKLGWNPAEFYPDTVNLALSGSSPIEMYYSLMRYVEHNQNPKAVIIGFAPIHYANMEGYTGRSLYFHWLENDELRETVAILLQEEHKDYTSEVRQYQWRMPNVYMRSIVDVIRGKKKHYDYDDIYSVLEKNAGYIPYSGSKAGQDVIPDETKNIRFIPLNVQTYYMNAILSICKERGVKVFIEQLPMGEYGHKLLTEYGYMTEYEKYMDGFKDGDRVMVNSKISVYPAEYFGDNSHLNAEGAKKFTQEMKDKYSDIFD